MRLPEETPRLKPHGALAELHAQHRAAGIDPLRTKVIVEDQSRPSTPFVIPRPDWEQERVDAIRRERAEHNRRLAAESAALEPEPAPDEPQTRPKRRGWRKATP